MMGPHAKANGDASATTRIACVVLVLMALGSSYAAVAQERWRWTDVARVVVVADVHGAYPALVELLEATGVVDASLRWSGGSTHLVSLGDVLDRGPESRRALDLFMRLEREAPEHGGRVHVTLGNHELMNLTGDLRYVSRAEYAAFAPEETAAMRAAAYAEFVAARSGSGADEAALAALFERSYPPGYFAHRNAFAPNGAYGSWLLARPAIVVIDDTAFVHGGLPPLAAEKSLDEINAQVLEDVESYLELRDRLADARVLPSADMANDIELARAAQPQATGPAAALIEAFLAVADSPVLGIDGPLWYRGSVYCKPLLESPTLDAALARLNVARVVVGHTPTGDRRVRELHGGKVVMLDTGMLADYYAGRPAALVIEGGELHAQYLAPEERVRVERSGSAQEYGLNEAQLHAVLESGAVASVRRPEGAAAWQVELRAGERTLTAAFYPAGRGGAGNLELAAAALDDLLGTALVPPTVARSIEGTAGALQLRYADAASETERLARELPLNGWCPIEPQLELMYAFDLLTFNRGRSADNVFYANELSDLTVVDHGRAFGTERLPAAALANPRAIPEPLVAALRALDEAKLKAAAGRWLDSRRIRALLARRDQLLEGR